MQTPFKQPNADFSYKAHLCARSAIYQRLFGLPCTFEEQGSIHSALWGALDGMLGVDRIIRVHPAGARAGFIFTSQERFRNPSYQSFGDVTITGWNKGTNRPGEIHKLAPLLFVYGFYDEMKNQLTDWVVLNTAAFMLAFAGNRMPYTWRINPRSNQMFIVIKRTDLRRTPGAVLLEAR